MKEVSFIFDIHIPKPEVFCKVYKDKQSYIAVAESNKFSTGAKHISIKYHHFWRFIQKKIIRICYIDTRKQAAENFNHLINEALSIYLRRNLSLIWN